MRVFLLSIVLLWRLSPVAAQDLGEPRHLELVDSTCAPGPCQCRGVIDSTGSLAAIGIDYKSLLAGQPCLAADFDGDRSIDVALAGGEGYAALIRRPPSGSPEAYIFDAGGVLELYQPRAARGPHGEPPSASHGLLVRWVGQSHVIFLWNGARLARTLLPAWHE